MKKLLSVALMFLILLNSPVFTQCRASAKDGPPSNAAAESKDTISLDFKGMDVVDVLKLLAQRGNLNIAVSKNVRGKVTMFLKDVNIDDAFEIILATNDLAFEMKGGVYTVMTSKEYEKMYGQPFRDRRVIQIFELKHVKASDVSKALTQIKTKIGKIVVDEGSNSIIVMDSPQIALEAKEIINALDKPVETRVYSLDYARAEEVKAKLEEMLTKNIGMAQVDDRTNKVIVTDLASKMGEIESLVGELDEKTREVLIEAKILEITLNDEYKWGINWDHIVRIMSNLSEMAIGMNYLPTSAFTGAIIPAESGAVTGTALELGTLDHHKYHYLMQMLETIGKTEVLSSPRIVVVNNEEASIMVGTNQPFATTGTTVSGETSQTTQHVTYVDLGVKLRVTPTINSDGYVTMKIKPEKSSRTGYIEIVSEEGTTIRTTEIPIIQTSEAETTVMVKDGNTIILAGLIEKRDEEEVNKVPFFGDIPLLGWAFQSKTEGNDEEPERKELVIFLTPHIISGDEKTPEVAEYLTTTEPGKAEVIDEQPKRKRTSLKWFNDLKKKQAKREDEVAKRRAPRKRFTDIEYESPENYYRMVRDRVIRYAGRYYPRSGVYGDVYISFSLSSDGALTGEPRILAAADESLKILAVKSVKDAAPFPVFPRAIPESVETFNIVISYK